MYLIFVNLILMQYAILGPSFCIKGPKVLNLKKVSKLEYVMFRNMKNQVKLAPKNLAKKILIS
jgi:hypothetical protein